MESPSKKMIAGIIYIVGGFALLLYVLGFFKRGLTLFLVCVSLLVIVIGFLKSGLWVYIKQMISKQ